MLTWTLAESAPMGIILKNAKFVPVKLDLIKKII